MKVKELIEELRMLGDYDAEIDIVVDADCYIDLREPMIKKIYNANGFKGYILDHEAIRNRKWRGEQ